MTRTIVFDLAALDDPVVAKEFFGTTEATDHNLYIRGRYVYQRTCIHKHVEEWTDVSPAIA